MSKRARLDELRARLDVLAVLRDVAAGGYETHDGRPIPAEVAAHAIRILAAAWDVPIKEAKR